MLKTTAQRLANQRPANQRPATLRPATQRLATQRLATLFASAALATAVLTGCSSDNVDCGVDACTVTIDRTVNASASVLGVEAKFVSADANTVTLEVAGEQISLTKGQQAVQVGGLAVSLDSVSADDVQIQVARQ